MDLGGIDTSRYTGSITYAGVTVEGYWQFTVDSFRLSTMSSNIETSFQAILDTGTTLIIAPTVLRDHINTALGASYNTQSRLVSFFSSKLLLNLNQMFFLSIKSTVDHHFHRFQILFLQLRVYNSFSRQECIYNTHYFQMDNMSVGLN